MRAKTQLLLLAAMSSLVVALLLVVAIASVGESAPVAYAGGSPCLGTGSGTMEDGSADVSLYPPQARVGEYVQATINGAQADSSPQATAMFWDPQDEYGELQEIDSYGYLPADGTDGYIYGTVPNGAVPGRTYTVRACWHNNDLSTYFYRDLEVTVLPPIDCGWGDSTLTEDDSATVTLVPNHGSPDDYFTIQIQNMPGSSEGSREVEILWDSNLGGGPPSQGTLLQRDYTQTGSDYGNFYAYVPSDATPGTHTVGVCWFDTETNGYTWQELPFTVPSPEFGNELSNDYVANTDMVSAGVGGVRSTEGLDEGGYAAGPDGFNYGDGTIALSGIPAGSTITTALLFWNGPEAFSNNCYYTASDGGATIESIGTSTRNATISFDGHEVTGENVGISSANDADCYNESDTYKADVTRYIHATPNGDYTLDELAKADADANGASLIVFYQDANPANNVDVTLYEGNDSNDGNADYSNGFDANGWNVELDNVLYNSGPATLTLHVSDGQYFSNYCEGGCDATDGAVYINGDTDAPLLPEGANFEGDSVPIAYSGSADSYGGGLWDIRSFDVSSYLSTGNNTLVITSANVQDALSIVVAALAVPTSSSTETSTPSPTPSPTPTPTAPPTSTPGPIIVSGATGNFFTNPNDDGGFTRTPSDTPVFSQAFPVIAFNPPDGVGPTCSNDTGILEDTRPFTDIVEHNDGTCSTVPAQGNGAQAGVGDLFSFQAYFTGTFTVPGAENVTFNFFSDDGWALNIGTNANNQQPHYVSGANTNPPASGPFTGYQNTGAFNTDNAASGNDVTVHFPGAGTYPFEIDYTECCGGGLVLVLTANGQAIPPSLTPTPVATETPVVVPTPTPTPTPGSTHTPSPTPTPAPTFEHPTATQSPAPTLPPTLIPPETQTPFPTDTFTPTPTATATPPTTLTPTPTVTSAPTNPPTGGPTNPTGGEPTPTPTAVPSSRTQAPVILVIPTPTPVRATATATATPKASATATARASGSPSPTAAGASQGPTDTGNSGGSITNGGGNNSGRPQFAQSVLTPSDLSGSFGVIGLNALLAGLTLLLLLLSSELFNKTVEENHGTLARWFSPITHPVEGFFSGIAGAWKSKTDGSIIGAVGPVALVLAVSALIYGALEPGFGLNEKSIVMALAVVITVGLITYWYNGGQIIVSRSMFSMGGAIKLFPIGVMIAAVCVVLSRLDGFQPGIIYGFIASAVIVGAKEPNEEQSGKIIFYPVLALLGLVALAWFLIDPFRTLATDHNNWWAALPEAIAVGVFVGGLEGTFFQMIPIRYLDGHKIWSWNKLAWVFVAGLTAFLFWDVLLHKQSSQMSSVTHGTPAAAIIAMVICFVISVGFYAFFRLRGPDELAGEAEAA
ncbi:MAG: FGLLP motif-containing membrane protein [Chloroflexota bacterium]